MNGSILIDLLGVRGSTPAPGRDFVRYGGHTSCVVLRSDSAAEPDLVLDAGTGIRDLGTVLRAPFRGTVMLTHLHWDHVHGLPFSGALLDAEASVEMVIPVADGGSPLEALAHGFAPPSFPVRPEGLGVGWRFSPALPEQRVSGWLIRSAVIAHKGGRTIGIRVERNGRSVVYMPDHDLAQDDPAAQALASGADVLLHDAQYLAAEIDRFRDFGHSTVERACRFADEAGVGHLVLTHHSPDRTDDQLDEIAAHWQRTPAGIPVTFARQGSRLATSSAEPFR